MMCFLDAIKLRLKIKFSQREELALAIMRIVVIRALQIS